MNSDLYYHFRRVGTSEGQIISLPVFDISPSQKLEPNQDFALRLRGETIARPIPLSHSNRPDLAKSGGIVATMLFEKQIRDFEDLLEQGLSYLECVGPDGRLLSEAAVFAIPGVDTLPVPDESNMQRVAGKMKANGFLVSGACWYTAIQQLVNAEINGLDKDAAILDWGVGCGRVGRYFLLDGYEGFHGIDIDQENIDWCQRNLPTGSFSRCDFDPPTSFETGKFQLVFGHSVFTHLNEESEVNWLKEIARILSDDGIACCTIGSEMTCQMLYNAVLQKNPDFLKPLLLNGRQDFGADRAGVDKGREGYYRLVSHTRQYILEKWSEFVDVKRIIPGFANNQDAVVFAKKK